MIFWDNELNSLKCRYQMFSFPTEGHWFPPVTMASFTYKYSHHEIVIIADSGVKHKLINQLSL